MSSSDRRAELRKVGISEVSIVVDAPDGSSTEQRALLEDSSASGASVRLRKPIAPGTSVKINGVRGVRSGVVRHCRKDELGYVAGVQIIAPAAESEQ